MNTPEKLLERLDAIAASIEATGNGLALLALGSVGNETERLDKYSDLDFFVFVKDGQKQAFLNDLHWMEAVAPIGYVFQNTNDGHKLLFADGVFCEYAIFEIHELAEISAPEGRVVWAAEGLDVARLKPKPKAPRNPREETIEWQLGEALTNLYIGMARFRRGEKLSAMWFVQNYALTKVVELFPKLETEQPAFADEFDLARRVEDRFPDNAPLLKTFAPGYESTPAAASAILAFLEEHFEINPEIKAAILGYIPAQ